MSNIYPHYWIREENGIYCSNCGKICEKIYSPNDISSCPNALAYNANKPPNYELEHSEPEARIVDHMKTESNPLDITLHPSILCECQRSFISYEVEWMDTHNIIPFCATCYLQLQIQVNMPSEPAIPYQQVIIRDNSKIRDQAEERIKNRGGTIIKDDESSIKQFNPCECYDLKNKSTINPQANCSFWADFSINSINLSSTHKGEIEEYTLDYREGVSVELPESHRNIPPWKEYRKITLDAELVTRFHPSTLSRLNEVVKRISNRPETPVYKSDNSKSVATNLQAEAIISRLANRTDVTNEQWISQSGQVSNISEMSDIHLINTIRWLRKTFPGKTTADQLVNISDKIGSKRYENLLIWARRRGLTLDESQPVSNSKYYSPKYDPNQPNYKEEDKF